MSESWTGLNIHGRQYPSIAEVQSMSVADLVKLRPTNVRYLEKDNFQMLFSELPDVRKLQLDQMSEEEFIQGWVDLWISAEMGPTCKKLHGTILHHLEHCLGVSQRLRTMIKLRHTHAVELRKGKRNKEKQKQMCKDDPNELAKWEKKMELHALYMREKRLQNRGLQTSADEYKDILSSDGISTLLSAPELEKATRHLRDAMGNVKLTSLGLRSFLLCRNKKEQGIGEAMLARRLYNHKILRKVVNERQKQEDRARRAKEKSICLKKGHTNHYDKPPLLAELLRQGNWWTF